jgi:hypothetical protein
VTTPPERPKIYHITHVDNLAAIVKEGALVSDRMMIDRGGPKQGIGMSAIKRRRVEELGVECHPGTMVGDFVPFYFCPRSVMLYVIHRGTNPELTYRGGQDPIVHLVADLHNVVEWAAKAPRAWAFSLSNAGSRYAKFRDDIDQLDQLNWDAIRSHDFSSSQSKEGKQAEFLVHGQFPFELIERIGVRSADTQALATRALTGASHQPEVEVRPKWYF